MLFIIKMSNYNIISRQNYGLVKGAQIMPRKEKTFTKEKMVAGRDVSANTETQMARSNMVMSMPEATQR